ncbi:MAG TPA: hypothetical protein VF579_05725 [Candidatus Methylomirabilis sp.]
MALLPQQEKGRLKIQVDYDPRYSFYITATIQELKLSAPITIEGKTFDVPPGRYTVSMKGLMGDPAYQGPYKSGFKEAYGRFDRRQEVEVRANEETVCVFRFAKPGVEVRVVAVENGEPLIGADVLIQDVDPNFRATRGSDGVLFHLEPGSHPVMVVTHGTHMFKEVLRVGEEDMTVFVDTTLQMALQPSLVVIRYLDGRMLKGETDDFYPGAMALTVAQPFGESVHLTDFTGVKGIFFVKTLEGNTSYKARNDFAIASQFGRRTVVEFADGETMRGFTLPGQIAQPFFFLFPVDPKANNGKVYVVRAATVDIRYE